jgi:ribosomal protein L37E
MAQEEYKCIKCGFAASRGFVADYSDGANFVAKWIEGEPEQVSFLGVKGSNIEIGGRRQFSVRSLRCERCGFLELYAV